MKTQYVLFISIFFTIIFALGCQSDIPTNPSKASPFYLNINLPSTSIDTLLEPTIEATEIDIYLKTDVNELGRSTYLLSVGKQIVSFDTFNDLFDILRSDLKAPQRIRLVTNLYIDYNTPYYLVDYLHKEIVSSDQHRVSYSNKMGQYFLHIIPYHEQKIWASKYPRRVAPPPPPPSPRRDPESTLPIFSESYLATLDRFGIQQKHIPYSGPELSEHYSISPSNILEIKLTGSNQVKIKDTILSLNEVIDVWQDFMEDDKLWHKRIVYLVIAGEADYEYYFEVYSTLLSAFQRKRNQLAVDMFAKNLNELPRDQLKVIYGKLPRIIIPELGD